MQESAPKILIGNVIRDRRNAVGIPQSVLALLAQVSRGTISNLERGSGVPEGRTIHNVAGALGITFVDNEEGKLTTKEVFSASATFHLVSLVLEISGEDAERGRGVAESFVNLVKMAPRHDSGRDAAGIHDTYLHHLATSIIPLAFSMDDSDQHLVVEALKSRGWHPRRTGSRAGARERAAADELVSGEREGADERDLFGEFRRLQDSHTKILRKLYELTDIADADRQAADALKGLPARIQHSLERMRLVDYATWPARGAPGVEHILLTMKHERPDVSALEAFDASVSAGMAFTFARLVLEQTNGEPVTKKALMTAAEDAIASFSTVRSAYSEDGDTGASPGEEEGDESS